MDPTLAKRVVVTTLKMKGTEWGNVFIQATASLSLAAT